MHIIVLFVWSLFSAAHGSRVAFHPARHTGHRRIKYARSQLGARMWLDKLARRGRDEDCAGDCSGDCSKIIPGWAAKIAREIPAEGETPLSFEEIRREENNVAVVERAQVRQTLSEQKELYQVLDAFDGDFDVSAALSVSSPDAKLLELESVLDTPQRRFLEEDIENIVKAYGKATGDATVVCSLALVKKTLCSNLHVDHVPLRLMVSYFGRSTEILDPNSLPAKVIAPAAADDAPEYRVQASDVVKRLNIYNDLVGPVGDACDIVLLKGERWEGNSGNAVVHRSPEVLDAEKDWRLVLRIDSSSFATVKESFLEEAEVCKIE